MGEPVVTSLPQVLNVVIGMRPVLTNDHISDLLERRILAGRLTTEAMRLVELASKPRLATL